MGSATTQNKRITLNCTPKTPTEGKAASRVSSKQAAKLAATHPPGSDSRSLNTSQPISISAFRSYNPQMPTWDETKRNLNIRKHGLDFVGCEAIFDAPVSIVKDASEAYGEQRHNDFHVISLREAEKHEVRRFIKEISS